MKKHQRTEAWSVLSFTKIGARLVVSRIAPPAAKQFFRAAVA